MKLFNWEERVDVIEHKKRILNTIVEDFKLEHKKWYDKTGEINVRKFLELSGFKLNNENSELYENFGDVSFLIKQSTRKFLKKDSWILVKYQDQEKLLNLGDIYVRCLFDKPIEGKIVPLDKSWT